MAPRPMQQVNTSATYSSSLSFDRQSLTPRTPRTRLGKAEEGEEDDSFYSTVELIAVQDEEDRIPNDEGHAAADSANVPLLAKLTSKTLGKNLVSWKDVEHWNIKKVLGSVVSSALPTLGILAAMFLSFLVVVSWKWPDILSQYIGETSNTVSQNTVDDSTLLKTPQPSTDNLPSSSESNKSNILSYANYDHFPLTPNQYLHECNLYQASISHPVGDYWYTPPEGPLDVVHHDVVEKVDMPEHGPVIKTCTSSITYMLDGQVGLAADLALMAQVAGLAREQERTFFVNDQYWNRGRWTDHFQDVRERQPGPERDCLPPPPEELVACPRVARHWVVNSRTAKFHLGHVFSEEFEDPYARELKRLKPIYERARQSFIETIRPSFTNSVLIREARTTLLNAISSLTGSNDTNPESYVSVHVRRGDRKAETFPYRDKYIPVEIYAQATRDAWDRASGSASQKAFWVASDSPDARLELEQMLPDDAEVFSLDRSKDLKLRALAPQQEYVQSEFDQLDEAARIAQTRGAVIDFALLSGAWAWPGEASPMATVCALSSNMCKLSAITFGWDRAFGFEADDGGKQMDIDDSRKRWVDVDDAGKIAPSWRAFEMF